MSSSSSSTVSISCCNSTRYIILAISTIALTFVFANSIALNSTIICMKKSSINLLTSEKEETPLYNNLEKSWLFSAVAFGNLIGAVPLMVFAQKWYTRWVFTVYGMISGISMLLMPLGVSKAYSMVFVLRMMQGFGLSICFTSLGSIVTSWAPLRTSGMYIALLSLHMQLGPLILLPVSGMFCSSKYGWQGVYYVFGATTIFLFLIFAFFYNDIASDHFCVSYDEAVLINEGKTSRGSKRSSTPYKAIFTDVVIIGVLISVFAACLGLQFMMQYGPLYLNTVLGLDIKATAFAAAFPYILGVVVKFAAGPVSDCFTCISEKARIIMFNTLSQLPICICFVLMATLPKNLIWLIHIAYSLMSACTGLNAVGSAKCVQLVARQHSGFIMAMMGVINSLVILILPLLVGLLAPDGTKTQWATIFFVLSAVIIVLMLFFNFVCQTKPRSWTMTSEPSINEIVPLSTLSSERLPSPDKSTSVLKSNFETQVSLPSPSNSTIINSTATH